MSQRFSHYSNRQHDGNNKYVPKTQKKFVPKSQTPNPKQPSLSSSLRQSDATAVSTSSAVTSGSRVRVGDSGELVPIRAPARTGGNFINYLPQDDAVATGLAAEGGGMDPLESQRVVDLLNGELSRLLKLNPREFWREVATDTSLHDFLDSFLKFRSRWYDFPHHGAKGIVAGVIVGEFDLSRRVFMTLYRISSNKDPGARASDSLSLKDHAVLLQEKKLLDLPKLLDICAIYAHENEELAKLLVENALRAQPWVHDNLTALLSHFLHIIQTMHQRCSSSFEALFSSGRHEMDGSGRLHSDFLEVMDFINDAIVSLDAFVTAYKPAAVFFSCPVETSYGNDELLHILVRLHDSLLPSLQRGFQVIIAGEDGTFPNIAINSKMLSMRILSFGWKLLDLCYLSDGVFKDGIPVPAVTKMFPAKVEDPIIRADILVQTFREISGISANGHDNKNRNTFLQHIELNYNLTSKLRSLQNTGWIFMDDEQFKYVSGIVMPSRKGFVSKESTFLPAPVSSNLVLMDEDVAVMESKISQVKDLFPDFGKGFLAACLEVYNQNPEEVIQRILEGTLHEDLQLLDTSLETLPAPKSASAVSKKEKGKGKLIETSVISDNQPVAAYAKQQPEGPSVSSSSSLSSTIGRYIRKSKGDLPDHITLDSRNEEDTIKAAALISQYEYEDEYDDSFDDLGLSVGDSGLEDNEILGERKHSNFGAVTEASSGTIPVSKWGTKRNPQYYVKDGKNYSYKVAGSVAVANANEAALVTQAQKELIHGLGRGGNLPLGAVKKITEYEEQNNQSDVSEMEGRFNTRTPRGRGRRGGGKPRESSASGDQDNQLDASEVDGRANMGNPRGRGRRGGGGGGGGRNHYRKDRAMNKHFSGLTGF